MNNPPNWRLTLFGVLLVMSSAVFLPGCQPGEEAPRGTIDPSAIDVPAPDGATVDPRTAVPVESQLAPAGADEGYIGDPEQMPDLTPHTGAGRDPDWDCAPTGNQSIDDWKRQAKCGGRLDGE